MERSLVSIYQCRRGAARHFRQWTTWLPGLLLTAPAFAGGALPQKATVVKGDVSIATAGSSMTVSQGSRYGIVNWDSFSIGKGNTVQFNNGSGATLNRVTGLTASQIDGTLKATGSLFLLNRNGIIIGTDGRVLTGGNFVASTMDVKDADFLDGGGYSLIGDSQAGVTNLGKISSTGGDVLLAGYTVTNSGSITAAGRVGLTAGRRVDVLTDVSWMDGAFAVSLGERGNDVTNEGRIQALVAELRTHNGNIYALAGNNDGLIQATGVKNEGGRVILTADGGTVQSSGTIKATRDGNGGDIAIDAAEVDNYGGTQDVSGAKGGTIRLTADSIVTDTAMLARGTKGAGGTIAIEAANELLFTSAGVVDASGTTGGGEIAFGSDAGVMAVSGQAKTTSSAGTGGRVSFLGKSISLLGGSVDASGATGGGSILVGGGYHGATVWTKPADALLKNFANSRQTYISATTTLRADATGARGNGGQVIAWSDGTTQFAGTITARGGRSGGDGGTVETSGVAGLGSSGTVDASAPGGGKKGTWLLDPKNITIGTITDPLTQFQTLVGQFGGYASDDQQYLQFGTFLDVSGTTAVIGANQSSGGYPHAAYVFESGQIAARLTSSTGSVYFGMGVGVGGDLVAVMDPGVSIDHYNGYGYTTFGAVYLFRKGAGWHNGSVNQIARLYDDSSTDYFGQWGAPQFNINRRFVTSYSTDADNNHFFTIAVGNPSWDYYGTSNVGSVSFYRFWTGGSLPSGDVAMPGRLTPDPTAPAELNFGDYLALSDSRIYIGTGSTVSAQQYDLYTYDINTNASPIRFTNYFQSRGRPTALVAQGNQLFGVFSSQLAYNVFTWPTAENGLSNPLVQGWVDVALNTSPIGGPSYPYGSGVSSVDVDGNELIIGYAAGGSGAGGVAIYEKPDTSNWNWGPDGPYQPVLAYNFSPLSSFQGGGMSVAISGDYAIAGVPNYDYNGVTDRGLVAQFSKTNGTWTHTFDLRPATLYESSGFGAFGTVAVDGSTIVVSDSQYHYVDQTTSGRVYVYENGALAAALSSPVAGLSQFGAGVDIDQNRIAVINSDSQTDWVGVFDRGAGWRNGTANFTSGFQAGSVSGSLGTYRSVSLDGDTLAVGVPSVSGTNAGYVDVFGLTTAGISGFTRLRPSVLAANPGSADNFGYTVAVSGNTIAASYSPNGLTGADGGVFLFENLNNNWATAVQSQITAAGNIYGNDNRGWGVSFGLDGDTLAIGYAPIYTGYARGVYVFQRNGTWAQSTHEVARLSGNGAYFGQTVAVDGDRIAVGSPSAEGTLDPTTGQSFSGSDPIFVYDRFSGWQNGTANLLATLNRGPANNGTTLGWSLAMSGDTIVAGSRYGSGYGAAVPPVFVFSGPYDFSGRSTFTTNAASDLNISAASLALALAGGTDITLQANNDITISSPITVNNPHGDGGALSLFAGRDILVNASIFTDNGDLTLVAGDPRANATYTSSGEKVVVLGRDTNNTGVTLNTGTGDILINAADRFENRTGGTSPFVFDATTPGRYLVYAKTPDHTGAPQANNLTDDLATTGWDFVYYNKAFDVANLVPSFLPAGDGFIYSVQPTVAVNVGSSSITYGDAVPAASLSLAGLTPGGSSISGSVFGIGSSDLANLVTTSLAGSVSIGTHGYVNAGTYTGGITAVAKTTVTSGKVYGVAVTTGAAGDLTVAKATLDVRPDDATRVYHSGNPTFTATYSGFVAGDDVSAIDSLMTLTSPATLTSNVGGYTISASGGADNNYQFNVTGTGLLKITPYQLTLTGLTGVSRIYDGTTAAHFAGTAAISPFGGDDVRISGTLTATGSFADKNVGTNKAITLAGFGLTGAAAGNYTLVLPTNLVASVTPASLTLSGLVAQNRIYDATTAATLTGTATIKPFGSDVVTLAGTTAAAFDTKNAGTGKTVTVTGLTLGGADAANYTLVVPTLAATITPLDLTLLGLTAQNRVYDATKTATFTGTPTVAALGSDVVTVTGTATGSFADKKAGTGKAVSISGLSLTGADAANYTLVFPAFTADIARAPLAIVGVTGVNRAYDGTADAGYSGVAAVHPFAGDSVAVTGRGDASFADKNAGTDKAVTITGFGIGGFDAANYYVVQPTGITAAITPRLITVTDVSLSNKQYDGTTTMVASGTPVFGNLVAGDDATFVVNSPVFSFPSAAAAYYQNVLVSGVSLTGADAANYDTTRLYNIGRSISPAPLRVGGVTALSRVYDGTTAVALSGGLLSGVIGSDLVTLSSASAAGTFANKNVGTAKPVTASGYALTGAASGNYYLVQPTGLTADVTPFTLNLLGLKGDKIYDGTASAPLTWTGLDAVFGSDSVSVDGSAITATYADKNAGANKAITLSGSFALTGADSANYQLAQPAALTGTIARRSITVSGLTIADKTYDGTTAGQIAGTGTFGGAIAGDDLSINVGAITITFADKNVGTHKAVALSGVTLAGADAANYDAATPTGITASIFAKDVTVTGLLAGDKIYDRTTLATLTGTGALTGTIGGDAIALDQSARAGAFADKNVGTPKSVAVTGLVLTGADATNYHLVAPTLTASITPADATVLGLLAASRVYDTTTVASLTGTATLDFGALNNVLVGSEHVSLAGAAAGAFADKNVGTGKSVTVSGLTLTGADAANYHLILPADLTAAIIPADLSITGAAIAGKTYDATTTATFTSVGTVAALGNDHVQLGGAPVAVFADKNVGTAKAVTVSGYALTGADAANYHLVQPAGLTATISRADLLLTGVIADDKVYDGTTDVPLSGAFGIAPLGHDEVSVAGTPSAAFADKNVGAGKAVALSGLSLAGADAGNYRFVLPALAAAITPRLISVSGLSALSRIYDGTTVATLAGIPTLGDVVSGDDLGFNLAAITASFATKNVGVNKLVTLAGNALAGVDAANYRLSLPTSLVATITTRMLEIFGVDAVDRSYDRTTAVALAGGSLDGVLSGDAVSLVDSSAAGTVADKNIGENKAVTVSGYAIAGADAANYTVAQPTGVDVTITAKQLDITGVQVADKFFDGTNTATVSGGTLSGVINGDDVALVTTTGQASFASPDVGSAKTVTLTGYSLGGADAANYRLPAALTVKGNILQSLAIITDVIPAEVLKATANAALDKQRAALDAMNAQQPDLVTVVDYTSASSLVAASIPTPQVSSAILSDPNAQNSWWTKDYVAAANTALAASAKAKDLAAQYDTAARAYEQLGQTLNGVDRAIKTETALRDTYAARISAAQDELAKAQQNLATIDEAKRRIETLSGQLAEATRLGRGSEAADYEKAIAEARGIVANEAAVRAQVSSLTATVKDAQDQLAASDAKVAELTKQKTELATAVTAAEQKVQSLRDQTDAAKVAAADAAGKLEKARSTAEAAARNRLEDADAKLAEAQKAGPTSLDAAVDKVMANPSGLAAQYPLSSDRAQVVNEARAAVTAIDNRIAAQQAVISQADAAIKAAPVNLSSLINSGPAHTATRGLSSDQIAKIDPQSLGAGIPFNQIIGGNSSEVVNLDATAKALNNSLNDIGSLLGPVLVDGKLKKPELELPTLAVNTYPSFGLSDIDKPLKFDAASEQALKANFQTAGVLPKFNNPALANLPVAQQLHLQELMGQAAAKQADLIKGGMDPDEAARQSFDKQTNDMMTMVLMEGIDEYGIGDVPGVQEFVSGAIGELSAQYGVSPSGLATNLMAGNLKGVAGSGVDVVKNIAGKAQQIVTNPAKAGVQIAKDAYNVVKAGGEAFVNAWTGGGGGDDKAAQQQAADEARRTQFVKVAAQLAALEDRREAAVTARDQSLAQVKDLLVANAQKNEAADSIPQLQGQKAQAQAQADAVAAKAQREQVADALSSSVSQAQQEHDRQVAAAQAERDALAAQVGALSQSKPNGP